MRRMSLPVLGAFLFAGFGIFAAEPVISADRADCLYATGERVVFTVRGGDSSLGAVRVWIDDGGTTVVARAVCDFAATNVCELSAKRDTPGALRLRVAGPKCKKCLYGVLCDWEKIRPAALSPSDFDAYWRGERERLAATVPLDPKMERVPARDTPERLFYRISFATFGGKRVHGAMTVPKAGKGPFPVRFHCPGAGPGKVEPLPCESGAVVSEPLTPKNAISVVMNINDFPVQDTREAQKEHYAVWSSALCEKYGVGNYMHAGFSEGRDEVVFHDPVLGILRALDWLADQPFADAGHFTYYGSSQGAALGYYLTALWGRFERTMLNVPAMGDLLAGRIGRAAGGLDPVGGNPASVRAAVEASVPYYDTANFAPRIKTPTLVVIGLSDDVCPFISAVSSYNLLGADKRRVVFIPGMGHQYAAPRTPEFSAWLDGRENAGELQMVDNKASVIGGIALYKPESWNLEARQKFAEQRFGIFIHWGLYANYAQGEWYLHDGGIEESAYARMIDGFCPSKFDAREWVRVFKGAGAKYVTITSRHHDGFSLWPTKADDGYNIANTPFGRDILGELSSACQESGLQLNFYYSLMDWHRADYPAGRDARNVRGRQKGDYASYKAFMLSQIAELIDNYHPGNIWFDGEWEHAKCKDGKWIRTLDWEFDTIYDFIHAKHVLVANNNHQPIRPKEDIQLFERDLPGENGAGFSEGQSVVEGRPIEQCDVIQENVWGYRIGEKKFRTAEEVVAMVARAAAKGSNLLMNIGPDGSGRLPAKAVDVLGRVGSWFEKNGESIYGTSAGDVALLKSVVSTQKGCVKYLHFIDPGVDRIVFKVNGEIASATYLANGKRVEVERTPSGDAVVAVCRPKDDGFDLVVKIVVK